MKQIIKHISDVLQGKATIKEKRSSGWSAVRAAHLKKQPACAVCGLTTKLEVHHINPFHIRPDLELVETNLITLCESRTSGANCHLLFGHLGDYRSYNVDVVLDSEKWNKKLKNRRRTN